MIGTTISHYEILEKLGSGGMGVVYKAHDTRLKRTVALKFLPPELTRDPEAKQRFIHEAQAASALQHNNICTIHDIDETDDERLFMVMDCYEGESLTSRIATGPMQVKDAVDIAIQVASGLSKAHEKGIVHRDIKPANLFITTNGTVKILDFGLAKLAGGQTRLTKAGSTVGTAAYMSPEQAQGMEVDHRTDTWSVGVVLYEMLTGKLPFRGEHEAAMMYSIVHEEPQGLASVRADVPRSVAAIIKKALQKECSRRYQTMKEMMSDLRAAATPPVDVPKEEKSIVVLPFENLSPDPDQEYFSDGLTEEVISDLSAVRSLRVISRSSAMTFKGTKKKIPEIARDVGVQYVLEGSVRKAGNNLRITAQLIDATNDTHLWAEKYSGTLDDVFDIQEKVSRSIVSALELKLTSTATRKIAERAIENLAAYEYYLKAYHEIWRLTEDSLDRALGYLDTGIEILGENAYLYSARGFAYLMRGSISGESIEYWKKAEASAQKALALSPDFSKALAVLGWICYWQDHTQEGIQFFKRALAIDPSEYTALHGLVATYFWVGKYEAALQLLDGMIQLDPLNPLGHNVRGSILWQKGQRDVAMESFETAYQMDPENRAIQMHYVWALAGSQRLEEAFAIVERSTQKTPENPFTKVGLLLKYGLLKDEKSVARMMSEDFREMCWKSRVYSYMIANVYALLGERQHALDWLEHSVNLGWTNYPRLLDGDPFLEVLRGEERFKRLMERVKKEWEEFEV
ncbi:MAG: tetratricopeptide repeat protein [Ignavibacteria bacterium]|nr:tetratricopeptide repeat protein [Ignavibacteria bacterium]